ncbi:MAG: hypothetical protein DRG40_00535 [Deltaproteobacteria bacterium]|nr:MAG: hypothetical protein DRG40_00535 [Deltaproteobacteria bacterium]
MRKFKLFLLLLLLLASCATVPKMEKPIKKYKDFDKPFEEVWRSTIEGLTRSGELISFTEKESGLIVVEKELSGDEVPKFTMGPALVVWHRASVRGSIFVKPTSESSTRVFVNVKIKGLGTPLFGSYPMEFALTSNGRIEKEYLELIEGMVLASRKFKALQKRHAEAQKKSPEERNILGIKVKALTDDVAAVLGLDRSAGVLVVAVIKGSPAETVDIQKGDVILELEGEKVTSPAVFKELVRKNVDKEMLVLKIMRRGEVLTIGLPLH